MSDQSKVNGRRRSLVIASACAGGVSAVATAVPFVASMLPSERALALGAPVEAEWRVEDGRAVVEMARASGLVLAGGPEHNDPLRASTFGTGQLIAAAMEAGARRVIVGVGGSASTDGGLGAVSALGARQLLRVLHLLHQRVGASLDHAVAEPVQGPDLGEQACARVVGVAELVQ